MPDHPFGWLSLLPPVTAIVMAIITKRVLPSLLGGVVVGSLMVAKYDPAAAAEQCLERYLWTSLSDSDHLRVFVFTLLMGAMVGVMYASRGMDGLVACMAPFARTRRGGQLTVWVMGLVIFFDDYANCLLLGNTMRRLMDRLRISREKLAFLVDSTAAPVAGLAVISTWIAGEISYIKDGFKTVGLTEQVNGFDVFVASIPYRFYVLWVLILVPMIAILGREFGPMWLAEQMCLKSGDSPGRRRDEARLQTPASHVPSYWLAANAILPVVITVLATLALIITTGNRALAKDASLDATWINAFGNGNSYLALVYGSLLGLLAAIALPLAQRLLTWKEVQRSAAAGATHVIPALAILWLSWALSDVTRTDLKAGEYLGSLLKSNFQAAWLPTIVFVMASFVSFSTGTSWGTMSVLTPLVIESAYALLHQDGSPVSPQHPLLLATVGSVLSGAIFGDHCSPISDTTVLSSQASGCDHLAHVTTQMPYALATGAIAIVCGTIPVGFGVPVWWLLPLGVVALYLTMRLAGKKVESPQ